MHRVLEELMKYDLFMSFRPDDLNTMVITFRKTDDQGIMRFRSYRLSEIEISRLNIDIVDVLLDFIDRFMKDFNDKKFD